ncbi:hypothetical protein TorRG33x02_169490 [Trema orientale]|uniref:Uncharacterized protein n=1 Tax=Trema orientale TaxID=63057 RepID=A0A2P5EP46_TREOI|nr:hypothetical protein TorRG33x02_169490 [Trema orientale]
MTRLSSSSSSSPSTLSPAGSPETTAISRTLPMPPSPRSHAAAPHELLVGLGLPEAADHGPDQAHWGVYGLSQARAALVGRELACVVLPQHGLCFGLSHYSRYHT